MTLKAVLTEGQQLGGILCFFREFHEKNRKELVKFFFKKTAIDQGIRNRNFPSFRIALSLLLSCGSSSLSHATSSSDCFKNGIQIIFKNDAEVKVIHSDHPREVNLISEAEWNSKSPITVNGTKHFITYSYDGEIPWDEYLKYAKSDPEAMHMLGQFTQDMNFSKKSLMNHLKLSEKQFDTFVIKKNSPLYGKEKYNITDLPPRYFAFMIDSGLSIHTQELAKGFEKLLQKRGYRSSTHVDMGFIEVTHSDFDSSPLDFTSTINQLNRDFPKASFHLHLGIPIDAVSDSEMVAISRAVESRIILSIAELNFNRDLAFRDFTSLKKENLITDHSVYQYRGVIRMGLNEFTRAHNLEIREYQSLKKGIETVRIAANLTKNSKTLYRIPDFNPRTPVDDQTSNLNGALEYIGRLFLNHGDPDSERLGSEMIRLSRQVIDHENKIKPEMRTVVQKFLKNNKILQRMNDPSLYLHMK